MRVLFVFRAHIFGLRIIFLKQYATQSIMFNMNCLEIGKKIRLQLLIISTACFPDYLCVAKPVKSVDKERDVGQSTSIRLFVSYVFSVNLIITIRPS